MGREQGVWRVGPCGGARDAGQGRPRAHAPPPAPPAHLPAHAPLALRGPCGVKTAYRSYTAIPPSSAHVVHSGTCVNTYAVPTAVASR